MSGDGTGLEMTAFGADRKLRSARPASDQWPAKVQQQIDAKRATADEMRKELGRVTEELRSTMYIVRDADGELDSDRPEHPQIKQKALVMVRTALEDAIVSLETDIAQLETDALDSLS